MYDCHIFSKKDILYSSFSTLYIFLFNIKNFISTPIEKKNYIFYVVFGIEFVFILKWYMDYMPWLYQNATIQVTPAYQVEDITYNFRYYPASDVDYPSLSRYLSIPFYSWYIDHFMSLL